MDPDPQHGLTQKRQGRVPKIGCDVLHGLGEQVAQGGELLLVVLHGLGQVHQVVQVHGVVLSLRQGYIYVPEASLTPFSYRC
jgi:hypothetical protein